MLDSDGFEMFHSFDDEKNDCDENDDGSKLVGCDFIDRHLRSKLAMSMHSMVMVHGMHRCCMMSMIRMDMVKHNRLVLPKWNKPKPMDKHRMCRKCQPMVLERPRQKQTCTQAKAVRKKNKTKQNEIFYWIKLFKCRKKNSVSNFNHFNRITNNRLKIWLEKQNALTYLNIVTVFF